MEEREEEDVAQLHEWLTHPHSDVMRFKVEGSGAEREAEWGGGRGV